VAAFVQALVSARVSANNPSQPTKVCLIPSTVAAQLLLHKLAHRLR